jgi:hypothetical protein
LQIDYSLIMFIPYCNRNSILAIGYFNNPFIWFTFITIIVIALFLISVRKQYKTLIIFILSFIYTSYLLSIISIPTIFEIFSLLKNRTIVCLKLWFTISFTCKAGLELKKPFLLRILRFLIANSIFDKYSTKS